MTSGRCTCCGCWGVQIGEIDGDAVEPPVPQRFDELTGSQDALVEFPRIDPDLVEVAAS